MSRDDIEKSYAKYRRFALTDLWIMLSTIIGCSIFILVYRYFSIGSLVYPERGTDYVACIIFTIWILCFFLWQYFRDLRNLRKCGLVCPHCNACWRNHAKKNLLLTNTCPHCNTNLLHQEKSDSESEQTKQIKM